MKLSKGLVGLMAGVTFLTSGCSVIDANRSLYEMDRKGKVLSPSQQMVVVDSYQKNLFRNYMEAADDTMPKEENSITNVFNRKPEVVYGRNAIVREMQKERDADGYIGIGVAVGNAATAYGICVALGACGDSGSSGSSSGGNTPVNPPIGSKSIGSGGSNSNIIFDAVGSGWNP